jgi:hypothetical protein
MRRTQLVLAAVFLVGCAFRSFVPRADVQRLCLVDSWVSAVMVGRAVATIAELALAAQWALFLREMAHGAHAGLVQTLARMVLPLIAFAEVCSWYAVLSTNYLGNTMEESTWTLVAVLLTTGLAVSWLQHRGRSRWAIALAATFTACYATFMALVDVPMYFSRWRHDEAAGRIYLTLAQGIRDAAGRWVVTFRWEEWREEMPWMSLYFTLGVWVSIALSRAPYPAEAQVPAARRARRVSAALASPR